MLASGRGLSASIMQGDVDWGRLSRH